MPRNATIWRAGNPVVASNPTLCRTIQAREKLAPKLAEAQRRLAKLPWYRWAQRLSSWMTTHS